MKHDVRNGKTDSAPLVRLGCGEFIFNKLVLVGAVKMADRVVREMMGL